ncbi:MAG: serine/threonine-protein kinase, partial [Myxococcota bacterium]
MRSALLGSFGDEVRVGRYVLSRRLGQGAMGVVHEAYDPELSRRVAIKFVRSGRPGSDGQSDRRRIAREAQAIARLSHANVIEVFDVGLTDDAVYLVMELVVGSTLRQWLGTPRDAETIDAHLRAAGRGLAAAHAAGIVHRDFKPDNILVGDDGRVRVVDFGLSRPDSVDWTDSRDTPSEWRPASEESAPRWDLHLTATGANVGTPAYMAPEQAEIAGTARSDQFAFCVTAFEVLVGERPYQGRSPLALYEAKRSGPPPPPADIEPRLWAVLARGLAPDPEDRFASMDALLAALPPQRRPRGKASAAGWGAVAVSGIAVVGLAAIAGDGPCPSPAERRAGLWDDAVRAEVRDAISGTQVPYAASTWERVAAGLDAKVDAWAGAHDATCDARSESRAEADDATLRCLGSVRDDLAATIDALRASTEASVATAVAAVAQVHDADACLDRDALQRGGRPPVPREIAEPVAQARRQLSQAAALGRSGRWEAALRAADLAAERARGLGYGPLVAEAQDQRGRWLADAGRFEDAAAAFEAAHLEAHAAHDDALAAATAISAAWHYASALRDADAGQLWLDKAAAFVARGDASATVEIRYHRTLSALAETAGDYDQALAHSETALARAEEALRPDDVRLAQVVGDVGNDLNRMGRAAEALPVLSRAADLRVAALGSDHPSEIDSLSNLGVATQDAGDLEGAGVLLRRTLEVAERIQGPVHSDTAMALVNLAVLLKKTGAYDEAMVHYERALSLYTQLRGNEHPDVAMVRTNMANVLARLGRLDEASAHYRGALTIWEAALSPEHPKTALTMASYGSLLLRMGKVDEADTTLSRALELVELKLGAKHPLVADLSDALGTVAYRKERSGQAIGLHRRALAIRGGVASTHPGVAESLHGLGQALRLDGQPTEAAATLSQALERRVAAEAGGDSLGGTRFALAQATWDLDETAQACALAEQAERDYAQTDPAGKERVAAWRTR